MTVSQARCGGLPMLRKITTLQLPWLTVNSTIEDLSQEIFHFCFTLRILGLLNLNIKAKYVNRAVDTAVTTAV